MLLNQVVLIVLNGSQTHDALLCVCAHGLLEDVHPLAIILNYEALCNKIFQIVSSHFIDLWIVRI